MKDKIIQWLVQYLRQQFEKKFQPQYPSSATATAFDITATTSMQMSRAGIQMLVNFEGFHHQAYRCPAQVWTIGFGTTVYPDGRRVQQGDECSWEQALSYKMHMLKKFERVVQEAIHVPLTQSQFEALVSLAYNIGPHAFKTSTLVKKLNAGDYVAAAEQFLRWNKVGSQVVQGLVNRRQQEKIWFEKR